MKEPLPVSKAPELIFGLVAPIGVDLELVAEVLSQSLKEMNYQAHQFRVTKLMREIPTSLTIADSPTFNLSRIASHTQMKYAAY
jgi:cytidine deaminase